VTPDEAKEVHRKLIELVMVEGRDELLDQLIAPKHALLQNVVGGLDGTGPRFFRFFVKILRSGLGDWKASIVEQIAEDDAVATRFSFTVFHHAPVGIFAASNRTLAFAGILETRFDDGLAIESSLELDTIGLLRGAGAIRIEKRQSVDGAV
jgi:hypothetical protein